MTKIGQIYKCNVCGNVVEVLNNGEGELVCCNQPMELLEIQTEGDKAPKHVPIVDIDENNVHVKVGEVQHPMEEEHYIVYVELILGDERFIANFNPGDVPEVTFVVDEKLLEENEPIVKEYCNVHGLWSN